MIVSLLDLTGCSETIFKLNILNKIRKNIYLQRHHSLLLIIVKRISALRLSSKT